MVSPNYREKPLRKKIFLIGYRATGKSKDEIASQPGKGLR
jgi:hypothetical protein